MGYKPKSTIKQYVTAIKSYGNFELYTTKFVWGQTPPPQSVHLIHRIGRFSVAQLNKLFKASFNNDGSVKNSSQAKRYAGILKEIDSLRNNAVAAIRQESKKFFF